MSRKSLRPLWLFTLLGLILLGLFYVRFDWDSPELANYKKVEIGMSVDEVQAILGPGKPVNQREIPHVVRAVNPQDAETSRMSAGSRSTVREYPTRLRPVVEGDYILRRENKKTGERILVSFKEGKVCEKDYHDPNYL